MHDIFVSYPRRDRERVQPIVECLTALGLNCFFDVQHIDGGDQFPDVIDQAVKSSACVLGVWSPYALGREWVRKECRIGQARGVLVTARIEAIDQLEIPAEFGAPHLVDLETFDRRASHRGFLELLRAVSEKCARPHLNEIAVAALSQPAVEALQRIKSADEKALRATWEDLKSSKNAERIIRFRDDHAKDTLLEFAISERLEQLATEMVVEAEALYPSLTRAHMLSKLRSAAFWKPARYDSYASYGMVASAPAYDKHASVAPDAHRLYLKAAELDNPVAMGFVAVMLQSGTGVRASPFEAARWCTKALKLLS